MRVLTLGLCALIACTTSSTDGADPSEGYTFAARYLSYVPAKTLTRSEADALIAAGLDIVSTWEQNGDEVLAGYNQGRSDAQAADAQATAAGAPATRPIYFAIDFDAAPGQQFAIDAYFDGVASILGRDRTGAYAGCRSSASSTTARSRSAGRPTRGPAASGIRARSCSRSRTASSGTYLSDARHAVMQTDGNLVVYGTAPRWASQTAGHTGAMLAVQNDGNVVVYANGQPIWATNTYGR